MAGAEEVRLAKGEPESGSAAVTPVFTDWKEKHIGGEGLK